MATEAKFSTVLPNNTLKGAVNVTPVSYVYQERTNTVGPMENEFDANDVVLSFNTFSHGSTATVMIPPSYKLLKDVYVIFKIDYASNASPTDHPEDLVAYKIIENFMYRVPGCERMIFDGGMIPFFWMDATENISKRVRLVEISGKKTLKPSANTAASYYLCAKLPLPCCSGYGAPKKPKPMPLHLQGEPLELLIKIRAKAECLSSLASISEASIYFNYSHLGAFAEYKNTTYKYMFDATYDYEYVSPNAVALNGEQSNATGTARRQVVMTGIRSGETPQLKIKIYEKDSGNTKLYKGLKIRNIQVYYAGQRIWAAENEMQEFYELDYNHDINFFASSFAGIDTESNRSYWYHIPIGNILNHEKDYGYVLGADFNNSELKISYTLDVATTAGTTDHILAVQQSVTSIYQYNGERASLIQ